MRSTTSLLLSLSLGLVASLEACSSATLQSASGFRDENRANVERLSTGMARAEVIDIMGTRSLPNPLGTEAGGVARTARDTNAVTQVQIPLGSTAPALYNPMRSATWW